MTPLLLAVLAYIALQLAIGAWVSRRIASEDDYLLAGRRLGAVLAPCTVFATWFGAETCLGAAGQVYDEGLSLATTEPFAYGACLVLLGLVFAGPLWRRRLTTLADLFRQRYSPAIERLAALLMIPTSLLWAAAQIRAFGQVLSSASALEVDVAIALAATVVIVYTALGGLLADAITDLVQGAALIVGLVVMAVVVVSHAGGPSAALGTLEPGRIALAPSADWSALDALEAWAAPVLGSVVAQELVARVSAARSGAVARGAALGAGLAYVTLGVIPVLLGLLGAALVPGLDDGEQVLPQLAARFLPVWAHALFAGALVSAILSTVDSTLLVCASLLSHNLIVPVRPGLDQRARVRIARAGVVAFGLLATAIAWNAGSVAALVHEASALGSAGILVVVVFGLFSRRGGSVSAGAALIAGAGVYVAAVAAGASHPYLASLAASLLAYAAGTLRAPAALSPRTG